MSTYQYRVIPAPSKSLKAKGVKGPEACFSNTIEDLMNLMGSQGWEFQRAETLPSVERSGLTGSTTKWRNVLVFRKPRFDGVDAFMPELQIAHISNENAAVVDTPETPKIEAEETPDDEHPAGGKGATQMLPDNGVEGTSEVAGMTDSLKSLASRRSPDNSDS
jgi:hypothetical protein